MWFPRFKKKRRVFSCLINLETQFWSLLASSNSFWHINTHTQLCFYSSVKTRGTKFAKNWRIFLSSCRIHWPIACRRSILPAFSEIVFFGLHWRFCEMCPRFLLWYLWKYSPNCHQLQPRFSQFLLENPLKVCFFAHCILTTSVLSILCVFSVVLTRLKRKGEANVFPPLTL